MVLCETIHKLVTYTREDSMAKRRHKFDLERFTEAVEDSGGIMITIAANMGVDRKTIATWRDEIPEVRELIENEIEKTLDHAENGLVRAMRDGDLKAINFLLSTRGKSRGYTTKVENEIKGSLETTGKVTVYLPDNQRDVPAPKVNLSDT